MAALTRSAVSARTSCGELSTLDTVCLDTPARAATDPRVARSPRVLPAPTG